MKTDHRLRRAALSFVLVSGPLLSLAGCGGGYSPNTYASNAAQEEAAVQRGVIIGVRQVMISADGTIGAATGGAVGGVAGSQVPGATVATALGAIGGTLVGGIGGNMAAHAVGDAKGWEYIVQETPDDKLVSVTQTSRTPLAVGLHVLVIAGAQQARIVPDYTVEIAAAAPAKAAAADADKTVPAGNGTATLEINISPVLPAAGAAGGAPVTVASDPAPAPGAASGDAVAAPKAAPTLAGGAVTDGSTGGEGSALATASAGAAPNAGQVAPAAAAATPMVTPAGVTSH